MNERLGIQFVDIRFVLITEKGIINLAGDVTEFALTSPNLT